MDKPNYLGIAVLELSQFFFSETYYDKFQPFLGEKMLQLHYMDIDSSVLSVITKDTDKDL